MLSILIFAISYHSANVFTNIQTNSHQIRQSILKFSNTTLSGDFIKRKDIVESVSDDIVFDAISGSRSGIVKSEDFYELVNNWEKKEDLNDFSKKLRMAQTSVIISQTIYILLQFTGLYVVLKVFSDYLQSG
jgi:hypothetical protein